MRRYLTEPRRLLRLLHVEDVEDCGFASTFRRCFARLDAETGEALQEARWLDLARHSAYHSSAASSFIRVRRAPR